MGNVSQITQEVPDGDLSPKHGFSRDHRLHLPDNGVRVPSSPDEVLKPQEATGPGSQPSGLGPGSDPDQLRPPRQCHPGPCSWRMPLPVLRL